MINSQLLPCPFCGEAITGRARHSDIDLETRFYYIHCNVCDTDGPKSWDQDSAAGFWNDRAIVLVEAPIPANPWTCGDIGYVDGVHCCEVIDAPDDSHVVVALIADNLVSTYIDVHRMFKTKKDDPTDDN